jgi:hypothetical protein
MNATMSASTPRTVQPAGSIPRPWLWQVWAAIIVGLVAMLAVHYTFQPPLAVTSPTLSFLGDTCTVSFRATNNTDQAIFASFVVIAGIVSPAGDSTPPTDTEVVRKTLSVTLTPKQTANLSSEFSVSDQPRPNNARIEIETNNKPVQ